MFVFQASLNEALFKIVPVLELIHRSLQDRQTIKLDSGSLPDLCNELGDKLILLSDLERKLMSDKQDRCLDDFYTLVQVKKPLFVTNL
jgi:hypothetical protein